MFNSSPNGLVAGHISETHHHHPFSSVRFGLQYIFYEHLAVVFVHSKRNPPPQQSAIQQKPPRRSLFGVAWDRRTGRINNKSSLNYSGSHGKMRRRDALRNAADPFVNLPLINFCSLKEWWWTTIDEWVEVGTGKSATIYQEITNQRTRPENESERWEDYFNSETEGLKFL